MSDCLSLALKHRLTRREKFKLIGFVFAIHELLLQMLELMSDDTQANEFVNFVVLGFNLDDAVTCGGNCLAL